MIKITIAVTVALNLLTAAHTKQDKPKLGDEITVEGILEWSSKGGGYWSLTKAKGGPFVLRGDRKYFEKFGNGVEIKVRGKVAGSDTWGTVLDVIEITPVKGQNPKDKPKPHDDDDHHGKHKLYKIAYMYKGNIYVIDSDGINQKQLTTSAKNYFPSFSPNGKKILFVSFWEGNKQIYTMNPDGTDPKKLTKSGEDDDWPVWSPDGKKVLFIRTPSSKDTSPQSHIYVMDNDGTDTKKITDKGGRYLFLSWSPDGKKIGFVSIGTSTSTQNTDIFFVDADGSNLKKIFDGKTDSYHAWSPDWNLIVFNSESKLSLVDSKGSNLKNLTDGYGPIEWSPNGKKIAYRKGKLNQDYTIYDLCVVNSDGSGAKRLTHDKNVHTFSWSPDGRKIACVCYTNDFEIHLMDSDGQNFKKLTQGGDEWSPISWAEIPPRK